MEGANLRYGLISTVIISLMGSVTKFDYGDQVQVRSGQHKDRLGDVVGMTITDLHGPTLLSWETAAMLKSKRGCSPR
jgi:hypothetical protein